MFCRPLFDLKDLYGFYKNKNGKIQKHNFGFDTRINIPSQPKMACVECKC